MIRKTKAVFKIDHFFSTKKNIWKTFGKHQIAYSVFENTFCTKNSIDGWVNTQIE